MTEISPELASQLVMSNQDVDGPPLCYYGGGADEHAWIVLDGKVTCRDCPEELSLERLLEVFTEYDRIVKTGLAILQGELEQHRADITAAAGELMVSVDDMPPGSSTRRVVIANRLLLHSRNEGWSRISDLRRGLEQAIRMAEAGCGADLVRAELVRVLGSDD